MIAAGTTYIPYRFRPDVFRLWYLSDLHWLSAGCAEDHVRRDIQAIADDPFSLWIGGGDYVDFISHQDKRFDPDAISPRVSVADLVRMGALGFETIRDLFRPISSKCLGLIEGNHERTYTLRTEQRDRQGWLCTELGVPNLGYSALLQLVFIRYPKCSKSHLLRLHTPAQWKAIRSSAAGDHHAFRVWCHHGAGYAQTKGGKINRLTRFMETIDADIYMMGHIHDQTGTRHPAITANKDCTVLTERQRIGVVSGGYLRTYTQGHTTYAEQRGYSPTTLGAAWVMIRPSTRQIEGRI